MTKAYKTVKTATKFLPGPGRVATISDEDARQNGIASLCGVACFWTKKGYTEFAWNEIYRCWVEVCVKIAA